MIAKEGHFNCQLKYAFMTIIIFQTFLMKRKDVFSLFKSDKSRSFAIKKSKINKKEKKKTKINC